MKVTKTLVKIGRILGALIIGGLAGYMWYNYSPESPFYYPIGLGIFTAGVAYLFMIEKNISGGLANNIRSVIMGLLGVGLGYMWYTQYKDIQQAVIVGVISVILLVLLGKKAFTKGESG